MTSATYFENHIGFDMAIRSSESAEKRSNGRISKFSIRYQITWADMLWLGSQIKEVPFFFNYNTSLDSCYMAPAHHPTPPPSISIAMHYWKWTVGHELSPERQNDLSNASAFWNLSLGVHFQVSLTFKSLFSYHKS